MFGWEFPPIFREGLERLVLALPGAAKHGVKMIFVVPKAYGDEDQSAVRLLPAEDVDVSHTAVELEEFWKQIVIWRSAQTSFLMLARRV